MKKLLFVFALLVTQACNNSENKVRDYLASGKSYYQKGNYDKATIEFKNVLHLNDKHTDAYYHLALIDEKNKNWQGMQEKLTKVTQLDPKNKEALLKLCRLALLSGRIDEALGHVETALKRNPDNPDALALKGTALVKQGKLDKALALADQVLQHHPDHNDAISLKTAIYLSKHELPTALATVEQGLQVKPNDASLMQLRLQVHARDKNTHAVEQDYFDLIKQFPDKFEYTYALVKHYSDKGEMEKALSTLQALIDKHPDQLQPKLALIDYQMQNKPELAEKSLAVYLAQFPQETDLHFRLATLYITQNKLAEAKQTLNKAVALNPTDTEGLKAKITLAKIAAQENDPETAVKLIKEVLSVDEKHLEGTLLKAKLDLQKGLYDDAISDLRDVLKDNPNSADALALIGEAYLKTNSPELAEESFLKALAINPANFDALMPIVAKLIKNEEAARADGLLVKALTIIPDHPSALQALAHVRLMQKDWLGAQNVADLIATKPEGAGFSKFLSGKISEEQGFYKEATGQYKEALLLSPDLSDALRGLASSYAALKQGKALYAYLQEFITAHPDKPYPSLLKSQLLIKDKKMDEAVTLLSQSIGKWPKTPEFYESLATAHLKKKEADKAIDVVIKGLEASPDNIRLRILLASTYEQTGNFAKAIEVYEVLATKYPGIDLAVNNLVSLLLDHFNTQENIDRALNLAKRFEHSNQPIYIDSYAWALLNSGKNEEALNLLKKIVKKMPTVPVFRYHLATAYYKTNNKVLAIAELEEALKLGAKTGRFIEHEAAKKLLKSIQKNT
jgi:tetratricopeptide (TPR) repeat protein